MFECYSLYYTKYLHSSQLCPPKNLTLINRKNPNYFVEKIYIILDEVSNRHLRFIKALDEICLG